MRWPSALSMPGNGLRSRRAGAGPRARPAGKRSLTAIIDETVRQRSPIREETNLSRVAHEKQGVRPSWLI